MSDETWAEIQRLSAAVLQYSVDGLTRPGAMLPHEAIQQAMAWMQERCAKECLAQKRTTGPDIDPDDEVDAACLRCATAIRGLE